MHCNACDIKFNSATGINDTIYLALKVEEANKNNDCIYFKRKFKIFTKTKLNAIQYCKDCKNWISSYIDF
jgi:hypothetical protein